MRSYLSTSKNLVNWPQFLESQCTCHHLQNLIKWVRRLSGLLSCSLMYFWSAIFTNKQWSISIPLLKVASSWVVSLMHHKDGGNGGCANKSLIIITVLNCSIVEVYSIFLHKWGKNCKQGSWISDLWASCSSFEVAPPLEKSWFHGMMPNDSPFCCLITIFGTTSIYILFTRDYLNLAATWLQHNSINCPQSMTNESHWVQASKSQKILNWLSVTLKHHCNCLLSECENTANTHLDKFNSPKKNCFCQIQTESFQNHVGPKENLEMNGIYSQSSNNTHIQHLSSTNGNTQLNNTILYGVLLVRQLATLQGLQLDHNNCQ